MRVLKVGFCVPVGVCHVVVNVCTLTVMVASFTTFCSGFHYPNPLSELGFYYAHVLFRTKWMGLKVVPVPSTTLPHGTHAALSNDSIV